jgi:hypothetical protein
MMEFLRSALERLAATGLVRRVVDALFRSRARRLVAELDHQPVARSQKRILLGLVHRAHTTRFGRDHDFRRIRTVTDFRRLVPLRTPADLWRDYWQPAFPRLGGVTWPAPVLAFASPTYQDGAAAPVVPVSGALLSAHRSAVRTALSLIADARPDARLFSGQLLFLPRDTPPLPVEPAQTRPLEEIALRRLPRARRPYVLFPPDTDGEADADLRLQTLAQHSVRSPLTCIAGPDDQLARFFQHVKQTAGRDRLRDVWPGLAAVLASPRPEVGEPSLLVREMDDSGVLQLRVCHRPEGSVAVEDPRHGLLRLLIDHGVFFEFVPEAELGKPQPARHTAAEVEPGVNYDLAVTSPAGLWACRVGVTVRFERRDPPLLSECGMRNAECGSQNHSALRIPHAALTLQPPHQRNGGTPAAPGGRPARTPSSARADQG